METTSPPPKPARDRRAWLRRLHLSRRTLLLVVPLHLAAFVLLYLGTVGILDQEILAAHSRDAALLLDQAITSLHPAMVSHDAPQVRSQLAEFIADHRILDLRLYDTAGEPVGHDGAADHTTLQVLERDPAGRFRFIQEAGHVVLEGTMRVPNGPGCTTCHTEPGGFLGAATMRIDMTQSLAAARGRLRLHLGLLVVGWASLVGALNIVLMRVARRSITKLEKDMGAAPAFRPVRAGVPSAFLDPVSEELLASLRKALRREREQAAEVSSRLQDTQRLASLGQLAAGLAHEIKNPLAGVHGALELLRDETDAGGREVYDQMLAELDRVNGTIHALLSFARPTRPNRVPTDIPTLLDSAARLLRPALQRRGIALEVSTSPEIPPFPVDPAKMRQVLVNLISNAADAVDHDGVVEVRAAPLPGGSGLVVAVSDTGPGIQAENLDRIFEPFFTTKFSGTGLGLSVVRSLVEQHGGHVEVSSEPGKGTTFFVVLPDQPAVETAAVET